MKRICIFGVAFFLLCLMCNPVAAGSGWWDEDYGQRIDLTIPASSISGDLQQFPVMIHLGDASGTNGQDTRAIFTEIGADYTKLAIVTEDGESLPVEVAEWNVTAQEAWLYTPVNLSSSSDTEIYLYYDSGASANTQIGATGTAPAQQVWDEHYAGVWLMKPNGGQVLDSTANANHGTIYGATEADGPLGTCLSFDGVDDEAQCGNIPTSSADVTLEILWAPGMDYSIDLSPKTWYGGIGTYDTNLYGDSAGIHLAWASWEGRWLIGAPVADNTNNRKSIGETTPMAGGIPYHIVGVKEGQNLSLYRDGAYNGAETLDSPATIITATDFRIASGGVGHLHGMIQAVLYSKTARSPAWIAATNAALRDDLIVYSAAGTPVTAADFSANATVISAGETVAFTATTTGADAWSWDFGDGNTSSLQNPTHTYTAVGTYTVTLTASNDYDYITVTKTDYIDIGLAPVAGWTANATETEGFPATIAFTDTSTNTPTSWSWNFGDGSTSTAQNPTHTYTTDGTYQVTLTATNAYGTDTYSGYIAIGHAGYRPKATGTIAPIDTSAWQSLYEAFGGEEVVAADETGEPDWLTITTVSLAPFLSTWGLLFWVIFYAVPFIVPWIRQEAVIIPSILGLIIGPVMLVKLPGEYHAAAIIFLALSIAGIVLVAVTTKRSGY